MMHTNLSRRWAVPALRSRAHFVLVGMMACIPGCAERAEPTQQRTSKLIEQPIALVDPEVALPIAVPHPPDPMLSGLTPPAEAPLAGMWSQVHDWPINGLHATLLPNGRVLTYGTPSGQPSNRDGRTFDVWDPALGFGAASHQTNFDPQRVNSFCAAATFLPDGPVLVSGGNSPRGSSVLEPSTGGVTSPFTMASDRWDATLLSLADGRALILGGSAPYAALRAVQNPTQAISAGTVSMTPEIYEPATGFRSLFGAYSRDAFGPDHHRYWYPRAWVAP